MKLTKDLMAASAAPLVLAILSEGESYGYAIIQRVHELSGGNIEWTDGMLYPVLHRLEAQGVITAKWRQSETGRKRRYYTLQRQGKSAIKQQQGQWLVVHQALSAAWGTLARLNHLSSKEPHHV
jgi:DNA-binding PadR family transcriptional regulator